MFHFLFNDCFNILTFRYPNVNIIFNKTTKSSHLLFQRETKKLTTACSQLHQIYLKIKYKTKIIKNKYIIGLISLRRPATIIVIG